MGIQTCSVPIPILVKVTISVADILADLIIITPLLVKPFNLDDLTIQTSEIMQVR